MIDPTAADRIGAISIAFAYITLVAQSESVQHARVSNLINFVGRTLRHVVIRVVTKRAELMFDDRSMKILDLVPMGTVCLAFVPKVVPKITVCFDVVPLVVTTGTSTKVTVCWPLMKVL